MPKIPLTAIRTQPFLYAGKRRRAGEQFDAVGHSDAKLLKALKWAATEPVVLPPFVPEKPVFAEKVMQSVAETIPELPATEPEVPSNELESEDPDAERAGDSPETLSKPKRAYRRRDMQAES